MDYKHNKLDYNRMPYYFNAIYYCLLLHEIRFCKFIHKLTDIPLGIMRACLTKKFRKVYDDRMAQAQPDLDMYFYNLCNGWAEREFEAYCGGYPFIFGALLSGLIVKCFGGIQGISELICVLVCAVICCSFIELGSRPIRNFVLKNNNYMNYIDELKKQDRLWHRKWNRITFLFCIGGIISYLIGGAVMFLILIG